MWLSLRPRRPFCVQDVIVRHTRFTTRATVPVIKEALAEATRDMGGSVEERDEDNKLKLSFHVPNKGEVTAQVEIFEVIGGSPPTHMVEVARNRGEYSDFYKLYRDLVERGTALVACSRQNSTELSGLQMQPSATIVEGVAGPS